MITVEHANNRTIEWGGPDVMITDPPYSKHVHESACTTGTEIGMIERDLRFDYLSTESMHWTAQLAANVKRWSLIFTDIESVGDWKRALEATGAEYVRALPWVRWSIPQLSDDRPPSGCEMIVIAWGTGKGKKLYTGPKNLTHVSHKCLRGTNKHPTEKPLDLMLDLVSWFSEPGELVVDPFAGAATTALACKQLKRDCRATELNQEWAQEGYRRLWLRLNARDRERYRRWKESCANRTNDEIIPRNNSPADTLEDAFKREGVTAHG